MPAGCCLLGLMLLTLAAAPAAAQSAPAPDGPWLGVWKYNAAKSAQANGRPAPENPGPPRIFRMVKVGKDAFKYTIETTRPGETTPTVSAELIGRFDGKDYIEIGNPGADTNKFQIVDGRTYALTDTKDGKDLMTFRVTISPDGKTRTSVSSGKNARGEEVRNVSVYDRID